jgi:membrane associated rhomboid family serine protease
MMMYFIENPNHRIWQFLTHIFMHGSVNHLLFNMFGLWMFGQVLEKVWGAKKFLFFYLACGIGAAAIYMLINKFQFNAILGLLEQSGMSNRESISMFNEGMYRTDIVETQKASRIFASPMVGASGAIYGVLVAFALLFPNHKLMLIFLPVPIAAKFFVPAILLLDLFSGVTNVSIFGGGNVAHFAHIGGATIGFLLMMMWRKKTPRLQNFSGGGWSS